MSGKVLWVAAAVVLALGLWLLTGSDQAGDLPPGPDEHHQTEAPDPVADEAPASPKVEEPPAPDPSRPPGSSAEEAARSFAVAFTADVVQEEWIAGLEPVTGSELLDRLSLTADWRRPSSALHQVNQAASDGDEFTARYDSGLVITMRLVKATAWVVAEVEEARSGPES